MYVCLCKGITDTRIRAAVAGGCTSLHDVRRELGVASQCAKCAREARDIIRDCQQPQTKTTTLPVVSFWPEPA